MNLNQMNYLQHLFFSGQDIAEVKMVYEDQRMEVKYTDKGGNFHFVGITKEGAVRTYEV